MEYAPQEAGAAMTSPVVPLTREAIAELRVLERLTHKDAGATEADIARFMFAIMDAAPQLLAMAGELYTPVGHKINVVKLFDDNQELRSRLTALTAELEAARRRLEAAEATMGEIKNALLWIKDNTTRQVVSQIAEAAAAKIAALAEIEAMGGQEEVKP